jgi:hypothetical protein
MYSSFLSDFMLKSTLCSLFVSIFEYTENCICFCLCVSVIHFHTRCVLKNITGPKKGKQYDQIIIIVNSNSFQVVKKKLIDRFDILRYRELVNFDIVILYKSIIGKEKLL